MRRWILMALLMASAATFAQNRRIAGMITDRDSKEPVVQVTVQLLRPDSSFVAGARSDDKGVFAVTAPADSSYILKLTSVGYKPYFRNVRIDGGKDMLLGNVPLTPDAVMLKETTVTGQAAMVTVVEDSIIYNAAAFRTPEGSVVEELVKKLPGVQVSDDGTITHNGKTVKKIKVDGKEFMTGDTKIAMKNLPTSIVDKVKVYDEKSDLARITGIDDGDESTVLDFGLKEGMHKGFFGNVDGSIGTKDRYSEKVMAAKMDRDRRLIGMGNANNVNDMGFPGGGGGGRFGGGRNGLNATKMLGLNLNYEKRNKLQIDGSLAWNHSDGDSRSESSSENFTSTVGSFSNSISQNFSRSNSIDGRLKIEWKPDTMTNIILNPNINYSGSDGYQYGPSASFNADPYLYVTDPLDAAAIALLAADSLMVNTRTNKSASNSSRLNAGASLQVNRKLNNRGRNITFRGSISYSDSESKSLSESDVHLYQVLNALGNDSTYVTNRYSLMPTKNWNYGLQATYSEPLSRFVFLQFNYQFSYKYSRSDRSTYDFSDYAYDMFLGHGSRYGGWSRYFSSLNHPLEDYLDDDLSRFSEYHNYIHDIRTTLRIRKQNYNLNIGAMLQPQKSRFVQRYMGRDVDTVRTMMNFTPTVDFRYRFSRQSQLRLEYRGSTSQPSMSDLLDITDDSDPLNIKKGNPGLKSSFQNSLSASYNNFIQNHQRYISGHLNYSNTRNSISNMVTYDEKTGGSTTRPENINGNWNVNGGITLGTAIDSAGVWSVNSTTNLGYRNMVGYVTLNRNANSEKNVTRSTSVGETLRATFRKGWFEMTVDGNLNYLHTRNLLQSQNNLDTWQFSYGASMNLYLPWGTSFSTDMHNQSRRGYNDATMNTNELIWNAQFGQGFLRGKPLTVTLQFYDILHQQSNFSRTINAMRRSDTSYNSINSYAMLHVIYRMNAFGNREARRAMRGFGGDMPPGMREGGRGGRGGRGGGFGGGRPGGGGFGGFGGGRGR